MTRFRFPIGVQEDFFVFHAEVFENETQANAWYLGRNMGRRKETSSPVQTESKIIRSHIMMPAPQARIIRAGLIGSMLACTTVMAAQVSRSLFDGKTGQGWILCDEKPLPKTQVQADGLNPHNSGSYLVVHERKVGEFVLDFDYKLTRGCNSGVFIRVGDLKDPVYSGIEVALDDTEGAGVHDSGAFYDQVAPRRNVQKPAGEWNHMQVTAKGPTIKVSINGTEVSEINLEEWTRPGKRPDGSDHKFSNVAIGRLPRIGYFGFQDHGSDCWFKNITIREPN